MLAELVPPTGSLILEVAAFALKPTTSSLSHSLFELLDISICSCLLRFSHVVTRASSNFSGFAGLCITMVDGSTRDEWLLGMTARLEKLLVTSNE